MNYEYCSKCGDVLRGAKRARKQPKKCFKCLGQNEIAKSFELSKVVKEGLNPKSDESDGGNVFEDDPAAETEIEYGKVVKKSVGIIFTQSSLGSVIKDDS